MSGRGRSKSLKLVRRDKGAPEEPTLDHPALWSRPGARTIAIASGKGGVGKSNVAANLAVALGERGARVLLVDADLAQASLDLLLGLHPRFDLQHVLSGERRMEEIVVEGPHGVRLIPASSGVQELADLDDYRRELLLRSLGLADESADLMIVDTASGMSRQTLELCRSAHDLLVVATPELTSFSDAYGVVKALQQQGALARAPRLVVNMATTPEETEDATERMKLFARHFLRLEVDVLGTVPFDPSVPRAVREQVPVVISHPLSPAAAAYRALAARLWKPVPSGPDSEHSSEESHRLEA